MSMMSRSPSDTSVTFSLAELAKLEEERVRDEEKRRALGRESAAREAREAEAKRRAADAAKIAADDEARARRQRAEAEELARIAARQRAEIEVARIQAEAKARLDADNAVRAHELDVLRVRTETGRTRARNALAAALAIVVSLGGVAGYRASARVSSLEIDAERLRDGQQALAKEREHAKATELNALERRYAILGARPLLREAEDARAAADAARKAASSSALDQDRLRAFGDALDALQGRLDTLDRLDALDRRKSELAMWAADRKRVEATASVRSAATRARALGDESSLRAYEAALDQLRDWLAKEPAPTGGRQSIVHVDGPKGAPCAQGDPGCGLDGTRMW